MATDFTLMQGLGNTFTVFKGPRPLSADQIKSYCTSNHTDGLLVVTPIHSKLIEMKYWNADGSPAEMCGNGLRCTTRFAVDNNFVEAGKFTVKTDAGNLEVAWDGQDPKKIEVQVGKVKTNQSPLTLEGFSFYRANVGNPHAVTIVENIKNAPVKTVGPAIEHNEHFPNKTNVEFVEVIAPHKISMRVWERGVGETQACGTGMVATASICAAEGLASYPLEVEVPGGTATIWVDAMGYSRMIAPAELIT